MRALFDWKVRPGFPENCSRYSIHSAAFFGFILQMACFTFSLSHKPGRSHPSKDGSKGYGGLNSPTHTLVSTRVQTVSGFRLPYGNPRPRHPLVIHLFPRVSSCRYRQLYGWMLGNFQTSSCLMFWAICKQSPKVARSLLSFAFHRPNSLNSFSIAWFHHGGGFVYRP